MKLLLVLCSLLFAAGAIMGVKHFTNLGKKNVDKMYATVEEDLNIPVTEADEPQNLEKEKPAKKMGSKKEKISMATPVKLKKAITNKKPKAAPMPKVVSYKSFSRGRPSRIDKPKKVVVISEPDVKIDSVKNN
jgi:hypothetical protein